MLNKIQLCASQKYKESESNVYFLHAGKPVVLGMLNYFKIIFFKTCVHFMYTSCTPGYDCIHYFFSNVLHYIGFIILSFLPLKKGKYVCHETLGEGIYCFLSFKIFLVLTLYICTSCTFYTWPSNDQLTKLIRLLHTLMLMY